eukprot:4446475-Prymnesium_polylepis.1
MLRRMLRSRSTYTRQSGKKATQPLKQQVQPTIHSPPFEPPSSASSTANGSHVSSLPPLVLPAVSAPAHSASSRSAGCTSVPSYLERGCR